MISDESNYVLDELHVFCFDTNVYISFENS